MSFLDLLEFGTLGFAFIYRSEPRSVCSHFVGIERDTRLMNVFIHHTKAFMTVRRSDFRNYNDNRCLDSKIF